MVMSKSEALVEKVFTTREPNYTKNSTPSSIKAERQINEMLERSDIESTANPKKQGEILVLFVHGFAASKFCWLDPDIGNLGWVKDYENPPPDRDFGWHAIPPPPNFIPVDWTLSKQLLPIGATMIFDQENIEWLTYSQKSAFGDIEHSVNELKKIIELINQIYGERRIVIIAHSRGGLISKRFLDLNKKAPVEKLVTFGTPFGGTFMSSMDVFRIPSKYFLNKIKTARRLWDISQQRKVETISTKQMAPGSDFLKEIHEKGLRKDIKYVNVAGSCSHITNVYTWHWSRSSWKRNVSLAKKKQFEREELILNNHRPIEWYNLPSNPFVHCFNWKMEPKKVIQIYPKIGYKEVLQGDGAVSVKSALLNFPEVKQYIIYKNHIDMTCCQTGYDIMLREVKQLEKEV